MAAEFRKTVCRVCHVSCPLVVELRDGAVRSIHGDKDNPVYRGYSCIKGREIHTLHALPSRLLHTMKRLPEGGHAPISADLAAEEVADRLGAIIAEHGPRSVALFVGTYGYVTLSAHAISLALMQAIGSPMVFTSVTIDQPGKGVALAMHGPWLAGTPPMDKWDALLLIGTNPIISMNGGLGPNPAWRLKQARERGMKLVVIDPRETECARQADVFLQGRPGEDAAILAGLARELIRTGRIDHPFLAAETEGLEALTLAVEPFTPDYVADRAGIRAADLVEAARLIGNARQGAVSAGTGPNMSGQGNIVEYFVKVLTSLRGWWLRAGEIKHNPGVLIEPFPPIAASPGPFPASGFGEKMRVRGLTDSAAGLPTAALAEEILMPGEGQVKALIVLGGNPLLAWPDQLKTLAAMQALDLLVCFDPHMSATGALADYVFAPKLSMEVESTTAANELFSNFGPGWGYEVPYTHVTPPVLDPPAGSDLREEWEILYLIARRLGLELSIKPFSILDPARAAAMATPVDMAHQPDSAEIMGMVLKGSPIPYETVRHSAEARIVERAPVLIQEKPAGWAGRLQIGAAPMLADLAATLAAPLGDADDAYPLRLISRRMNDIHNSNWHENPNQHRRWRYNPAFINPADLARLGAGAGDVLEIRSPRGAILGIAEPSPEVRTGCVSMSHSWGRNPDEKEDPRVDGGNTGRLVATDRDFDPYTGIPRMSTIPVSVRLAEQAA